MIEPGTVCFEVTQYKHKKAILVETTWLVWYSWPVEIIYYLGEEFLNHDLKNNLREYEYGLKTNPDSSRNPHSNAIIHRIHNILGSLVSTYNIHKNICRWRGPMDGNPSGRSLCATIKIPQDKRKNYRPISLWQRHINPHRSCRGLEVHASV